MDEGWITETITLQLDMTMCIQKRKHPKSWHELTKNKSGQTELGFTFKRAGKWEKQILASALIPWCITIHGRGWIRVIICPPGMIIYIHSILICCSHLHCKRERYKLINCSTSVLRGLEVEEALDYRGQNLDKCVWITGRQLCTPYREKLMLRKEFLKSESYTDLLTEKKYSCKSQRFTNIFSYGVS